MSLRAERRAIIVNIFRVTQAQNEDAIDILRLQHACNVLLSPRTGFIANLECGMYPYRDIPLWFSHARTSSRLRHDVGAIGNISGTAMSSSVVSANLASIGECVERYSALVFNAQQFLHWDAFDNLNEEAIPPSDFALASTEELAQFQSLREFSSSKPIGWLKGATWPDNRDVYVPALFVPLRYRARSVDECVSPPHTSTGLAAGIDRSQLLQSGICECVERDAFMITYLNRLHVPELDLSTLPSPRFRRLLSMSGENEGIRIRAWNITSDIEIPTVLVAIIDQTGLGPAFTCGAASHPIASESATKALVEALQTRLWLSRTIMPKYADQSFDSIYESVNDVDDHAALSTRPQYLSYLSWLLQDRKKESIESLNGLAISTIDDAQSYCLDAVQRVGLIPISVDVTCPEAKLANYLVCRVLIPGLQLMWFGKFRGLGGTRVYDVPVKLGYYSKPLAESQLNPHPHPFP